MAPDREPTPPEVTVLGGPASEASAVPPAPDRRRLLLLVAAAGLAVLVAAVLGQRTQPPPPAPECPAPCLEPTALVVGAVLPMTGVLAPFGTAQRRGLQGALDRVNAAGGVAVGGERRRVQLLVRDTRSLPDVAGQEALVLVRGPFRLLALIGPCSPPVAVVRVAESRQVPLLTGCQPLPPVGPAPLTHTWEVSAADAERAAAVFAALRPAAAQRVGLFLSNDRPEAAWTTAAREAGVDVVGAYRPQGRDWGPAVRQAVVDGVEVVVAVTQPPDGIVLWQELRAQGVEPAEAYASEAGLGSAWRTAVGAYGNGTLTDLIHPSLIAPATPARVDRAVTSISAELTHVLLDALRRSEAAHRADVRAALPGAEGEVAGRDVRFLGDQASRLPVRLARWRDGRLVPLPGDGG